MERERARELRAQSWTLREIADELDVAEGSVSVWVRDVDVVPKPRNRGRTGQRLHPIHIRKLEEIELVCPAVYGCATVVDNCSLTHRRVMARIQAVTSRFDLPG